MLVLQVQRSFPFHRVLRMLTALPALSLRMGVGSTEFYNAQPTNQGKMSTGTSKNMYILLYELLVLAKLLVWGKCHHQIGFAGFEYGLWGIGFGGVSYISALSRFEVQGNFLLLCSSTYFGNFSYTYPILPPKKNATL